MHKLHTPFSNMTWRRQPKRTHHATESLDTFEGLAGCSSYTKAMSASVRTVNGELLNDDYIASSTR